MDTLQAFIKPNLSAVAYTLYISVSTSLHHVADSCHVHQSSQSVVIGFLSVWLCGFFLVSCVRALPCLTMCNICVTEIVF